MGTGRRLTVLLVALGLIGIPAAVLRVGCVGKSCRSDAAAVSAPAPFCSLPADLRTLITAGTYDGRSPDVIGVAGSAPVLTGGVPWPSEGTTGRSGSVDLTFVGRAIKSGRSLAGVSLDQVAPTLEPLLGLHRPHPEVRAGTAIPGVVAPGATTPLVVLLVDKGIGASGMRPPFGRLPAGVRTHEGRAETGSVPNDPIAIEATIGTGGLPSQHGITGAFIRNANGKVVRAFGPGSPQPVIATLGDDLDRATGGAAKIGLVSTAVGDAGLTGDAWYGTGPVRDRTVSAGANPADAVRGFLSRGWGADATPDLLAVGLDGSQRADATAVAAIVDEVFRAVPDATAVVSGTGGAHGGKNVMVPAPAGSEAVVAGGVFLDRSDGATTSAQDVVTSLKDDTGPDGTPLFADAFASYAVRFGRYC
ncbi:MAG: hypothetical protein ACJ76A_05950 [Actinomycetota bacterium]